MTKEQILEYLKEHKAELQRKYGIVTLGLFGSFARGDADKNSDIDIVYERDKNFNLKSGLDFILLSEKIAKELNVSKVDLVKLSSMNPIVKFYSKKDFIYV